MLERFRTYIYQGNTFYGLEVSEVGAETFFYLIEVKKKGGQLLLEEKLKYQHLDEVITWLKPGIPVFLAINTSSVISKGFMDSKLKGEALANSLFPSLDHKSIWFESYQIGGTGWVSIIKKKEVTHLLENFEKAKIQVFSVFIGLSAFEGISQFFDQKELHFSNCTLTAAGQDKKGFLTKSTLGQSMEYELNGVKLKGNYLLAFGGIVKAIQNQKNRDSNFSDIVDSLKSNYINKRIFSLVLKGSLVLLLGLLLLNFLWFSYYFERVGKLREERLVNENTIEMMKQLSERVGRKEDRLNKALSVADSRTALFFDQLADNVPTTVQLDEIVYQPLIGQKRDAKPILYNNNTVFISGVTSDSDSFSDFVYALQQNAGIENVETQEYDFKSRGSSFFKLKVILKK